MDPAIEHQDLRPPPEPRLPWMVFLAVLVNVLLIAVVAWGIESAPVSIEEIAAAAVEDTRAAPAEYTRTAPAEARHVSAPPARTACPMRPLLAAADSRDGRLSPPPDLDGKSGKDIEPLLAAGKEAAAAGQLRDAEVDYLTSCRVADSRKGLDSIESAEARYQLARHYVTAAQGHGAMPVAQRAVMFARAQAYYEDSLQRFRAEWGDAHEKTRFAAQGLQAARDALEQTAARPAAASDSVANAASPAASPAASEAVSAAASDAHAGATARMGAGPASPPAVRERPHRPGRVTRPHKNRKPAKARKHRTP